MSWGYDMSVCMAVASTILHGSCAEIEALQQVELESKMYRPTMFKSISGI